MVKYCANCGRELPDEAMYCPECGKEYIPRSKADFTENNGDMNGSSSSDYEFNGPFGPSSKKFEGPFGPHSNRGSNDSTLSTNDNSRCSSNVESKDKSSPGLFENIGIGKICLILFVALLVLSCIGNLMKDNSSNPIDSSVLSESANNLSGNDRFNGDVEGKGNVERNEPYNMSIDENAYISGKGEVQLIDENHSYNIESDEFNITEYETYYVNVDDEDWYVLDIFKCRFETPAKNQVYSTDLSDGDPIIIYGAKGDYYGYGILMPNSSDNSKYKNQDFLESIFYYNKE